MSFAQRCVRATPLIADAAPRSFLATLLVLAGWVDDVVDAAIDDADAATDDAADAADD